MPNKKKESTVQIAERLVMPIIEERGLLLWDVRFEKEGSLWYLRYFIDKEGGVNINDCEYVSRAVDKLLDAADPIEQSYTLEVSSPGIERELIKDKHYDAYLGYDVNVRLIRAVDGKRDFAGELVRRDGSEITIMLDDEVEMSFSKSEAASVKLAGDYEPEDRLP